MESEEDDEGMQGLGAELDSVLSIDAVTNVSDDDRVDEDNEHEPLAPTIVRAPTSTAAAAAAASAAEGGSADTAAASSGASAATSTDHAAGVGAVFGRGDVDSAAAPNRGAEAHDGARRTAANMRAMAAAGNLNELVSLTAHAQRGRRGGEVDSVEGMLVGDLRSLSPERAAVAGPSAASGATHSSPTSPANVPEWAHRCNAVLQRALHHVYPSSTELRGDYNRLRREFRRFRVSATRRVELEHLMLKVELEIERMSAAELRAQVEASQLEAQHWRSLLLFPSVDAVAELCCRQRVPGDGGGGSGSATAAARVAPTTTDVDAYARVVEHCRALVSSDDATRNQFLHQCRGDWLPPAALDNGLSRHPTPTESARPSTPARATTAAPSVADAKHARISRWQRASFHAQRSSLTSGDDDDDAEESDYLDRRSSADDGGELERRHSGEQRPRMADEDSFHRRPLAGAAREGGVDSAAEGDATRQRLPSDELRHRTRR